MNPSMQLHVQGIPLSGGVRALLYLESDAWPIVQWDRRTYKSPLASLLSENCFEWRTQNIKRLLTTDSFAPFFRSARQAACVANAEGEFKVPYCFSYSQNIDDVTCTDAAGLFEGDPQPFQAIPGAPSKCQCDEFDLGDQICLVSPFSHFSVLHTSVASLVPSESCRRPLSAM